MAVVDLSTGEIAGCKIGSATWWHEQGHLEFNKKESLGFTASYYAEGMLKFALIFVILFLFFPYYIFKLIALSAVGANILYYLLEEVWCWVYSIKHRAEWIALR